MIGVALLILLLMSTAGPVAAIFSPAERLAGSTLFVAGLVGLTVTIPLVIEDAFGCATPGDGGGCFASGMAFFAIAGFALATNAIAFGLRWIERI